MDDGPRGSWQGLYGCALPLWNDHREAARRSAMPNPWFIVSPRTVHNLVVREPVTENTYDIAVVGAGAVGLSAALAFARDGYKTVLIGGLDVRRDGRTVALLNGSV